MRIINWHRATFHKETLPRIRKLALRFWRDAMKSDDASLSVAMTREFRELVELRRTLLGFPSPGRRRNENEREERSISVPTVAESPSESPASAPE